MKRLHPASRHRSRQAALQVLYALDVGRGGSDRFRTANVESAFEATAAHFELPEGARAFAKELVVGVAARVEELDRQLAEHAKNWRVGRMAAVDRNILRLGVYELLYTDTPPPVIIDEAVELARRFGGDASGAFVNGVLDGVARGCEQDPPEGSR